MQLISSTPDQREGADPDATLTEHYLLEDSVTFAHWTAPLTEGWKGKTKLVWFNELGSDGTPIEYFLTVYRCHPSDLTSDHINFLKTEVPRKKDRPDKLGNWFNGYCYLDDGEIKYAPYT